MKTNRRSILTAAFAVPLASRAVHALDIPMVRRIDMGSIRVLSVSPDGTRVAGLNEDTALGIWDIASKDPIALVGAAKESEVIDPTSIAWKPNGAAFSFSVRAFQMLIHGRILEVSAESDEIRYLTGEPVDDMKLSFTEPMEIDTMPMWNAEGSRLHFVRSFSKNGFMTTRIMSLDIASGAVESFALVSRDSIGAILDPMAVRNDGRIVFNHIDLDGVSELRIVEEGERPQPLIDVPFPLLERVATPQRLANIGANGTMFSIVRSPSLPENSYWLVDSEADQPWIQLSEVAPDEQLAIAPVLHPSDRRAALVSQNGLLIWNGDEVRSEGQFQRSVTYPMSCFWGGDRVFVAKDTDLYATET